jgi:hypothetical protein
MTDKSLCRFWVFVSFLVKHFAMELISYVAGSRHHHHHHHHVHEGLGVFSFSWSSRWSWSLHHFLDFPMFLRPFDLHCSACFGILFVSILCTWFSHFSWYCFISFTKFCAPVFFLIHWFSSLSSFVIPSKCSKKYYRIYYNSVLLP